MFPVWRGIGASGGVGGGWSEGWGRCLRWETAGPGEGPRIPVFDYPVWLVLCRGGRARLREVCQRGRGAIKLPTDMLSIKLPQLFDIHQVPKVRKEKVPDLLCFILLYRPNDSSPVATVEMLTSVCEGSSIRTGQYRLTQISQLFRPNTLTSIL